MLNRRGFLGSLMAMVALPVRRLFHRNTLITTEWVASQWKTKPVLTIAGPTTYFNNSSADLTLLCRDGQMKVLKPGDTFVVPERG